MFGTSRVLNGGSRGAGVGRPEAWAGGEEGGLAGEQVSVGRVGSGVGEISWVALQLLTTSWILSEVLSCSFEPGEELFRLPR